MSMSIKIGPPNQLMLALKCTMLVDLVVTTGHNLVDKKHAFIQPKLVANAVHCSEIISH